jgi:hypothetical protein
MITFVFAIIAAFVFALKFFGVSWPGHDLAVLGLFCLAIAIAFIPAWPWITRRAQP